MNDVISNIMLYAIFPVVQAGALLMVILLPFEIKRAIDDALHDEPPRRRATDVKGGTSE